MIARSASSSPRPELVRAAVAVAAGALFLVAWAVIHHGFYGRDAIIDTPIYEQYGDAVADGELPYRDFALEYPPAALPVFVLPSLGHARGDLEGYRRRFEPLMALCGLGALAALAVALASLGAGAARFAAVLGGVALAPLALGPVVLSRFDLWPAALAAAGAAAALAGRERIGAGVLGLGFAAKLWPGVLLPPLLVYIWRRRGRHDAAVAAAAFVGVAALSFLPFAIAAPGGVWDALTAQTGRPLQIESLGAAALVAAHHVAGLGVTMRSGSGSQNLAGSLADTVAALQTGLLLTALAGVWLWFARGEPDRDRLVRAFAASAVAFVAFAKVLSPQFLIWLVPLVPLVGGRRGVAAGSLLAAAVVLTQVWFPYRYWDYALGFDETISWVVLARDLVLVALLAALLLPGASRREPELARS